VVPPGACIPTRRRVQKHWLDNNSAFCRLLRAGRAGRAGPPGRRGGRACLLVPVVCRGARTKGMRYLAGQWVHGDHGAHRGPGRGGPICGGAPPPAPPSRRQPLGPPEGERGTGPGVTVGHGGDRAGLVRGAPAGREGGQPRRGRPRAFPPMRDPLRVPTTSGTRGYGSFVKSPVTSLLSHLHE
jgi:hypothetical protein